MLVYAIGIDGDGADAIAPQPRRTPPRPIPLPFPFPGGRRPPAAAACRLPQVRRPRWRWTAAGQRARDDDRVNVAALRDMTDDSGGRTEIVRDPRDLNPATAGIADELSKQYYLGYQATRQEGRPLARDPRRSPQTSRVAACALGADYVASSDGI